MLNDLLASPAAPLPALNLTWSTPHLLACALVWRAKANAVELAILASNGRQVANADVVAICDEAIEHYSAISTPMAASWSRAYALVKQALTVEVA